MGEPAEKEREKRLANKERLEEKNERNWMRATNVWLIVVSSGDMFVIAEIKKSLASLFDIVCLFFLLNCYHF